MRVKKCFSSTSGHFTLWLCFISFKRLVGNLSHESFHGLANTQHACLLLKSTSMSVKEIASEVGYCMILIFFTRF